MQSSFLLCPSINIVIVLPTRRRNCIVTQACTIVLNAQSFLFVNGSTKLSTLSFLLAHVFFFVYQQNNSYENFICLLVFLVYKWIKEIEKCSQYFLFYFLKNMYIHKACFMHMQVRLYNLIFIKLLLLIFFCFIEWAPPLFSLKS